MDLNIYEIIKGPVTSTKANLLNQKHKKLVLKVHPQANKTQIKEALQRLYEVKVDKINTLNRMGKTRRIRRNVTIERSTTKRVIVTFKEGYEIDLFGHAGKSSIPRE